MSSSDFSNKCINPNQSQESIKFYDIGAFEKSKKPFNTKKLGWLIPIIIGLGVLFIACVGAAGLFAHNLPQWLSHTVQALTGSNKGVMYLLMSVGGIGGFVAVTFSIYKMLKKDGNYQNFIPNFESKNSIIEKYKSENFGFYDDDSKHYNTLKMKKFFRLAGDYEGTMYFVWRKKDTTLVRSPLLIENEGEELEKALKNLGYKLQIR